MNIRFHSILLALCAAVMFASIPDVIQAQPPCRSEPQEIPWPVPPAIAGQNGDEAVAGAAKVFVGERHTGNIQVWDVSGSAQSGGTLTPGDQLPGDVKGIWSISIPKPDLIVALATYDDGDVERYGILRSEDLGESWNFIKPEAMRDPHFASLEGQQFNFVDFTGNYWRAPLLEMTWLSTGDVGWVWGRKGILKTTDAGLTWTAGYKTKNENTQLVAQYEGMWGAAFKDADNGVAVFGPVTDMRYYATTDGGQSWTESNGSALATFRLAKLDYKGGEYRSLAFKRFEIKNNSFMYYSPNDGQSWLVRGNVRNIAAEGVFMIEWLWPSPEDGFLIYRRGELWKTTNSGDRWNRIQEIDTANYPEIRYGDGTFINGMSGERYPYAGYGQRTIIVKDGFGDSYMVQAFVTDCSGEVDGFLPVWDELGEFSSVRVVSQPLLDMDLEIVPNPTSERCEVRFAVESASLSQAVLTNSRGEVVRTHDMGLLESGNHVKSIDLEGLPSGSYRLLIRAGEHRGAEPVVIER